jgi:hypothetical protein
MGALDSIQDVLFRHSCVSPAPGTGRAHGASGAQGSGRKSLSKPRHGSLGMILTPQQGAIQCVRAQAGSRRSDCANSGGRPQSQKRLYGSTP